MIRLRHKLLIHGLRVFDQLSLAFSLFVTVALAKGVQSLPQVVIVFEREYKLIESVGLILMFIAWTFVYNRFVRYDTNQFVSLLQQIYTHAKASTTTAFLLLLVGAIFQFETLSLGSIAVFWSLNLILGILARLLIRIVLSLTRTVESNLRNALILGTNDQARDLADRIGSNLDLGYNVVGFIQSSSEPEPADTSKVVANIENLESALEKEKIDEIIICLPFQKNVSSIIQAISLGHDLGIVVRVIPKLDYGPILKSLHIETFEGDYILTFFRESQVLQLLVKRLMDFFGSLLLLLVLSPLFALIALAVRLDSKGPIFFAQERVGMNKRSFLLYKFRSMVVNAEELKAALTDQNEVDGPVFKIKRDPRITRVGRFIRKTSLDELPQLWNTLIGDMSLVGPRPPLFSEVDQYEWLFRKRLSIKPGITCLWQVNGRNQLTFDQWMELDKEYIENWSLWLDIKILLKTIPTVLFGRGAS